MFVVDFVLIFTLLISTIIPAGVLLLHLHIVCKEGTVPYGLDR
jgi:hypothetical protein